MKIGIHAKAAFKYQRTGVDEYVYQLIKHFAMLDESRQHEFTLYTPPFSGDGLFLPKNFIVKTLRSPFFWTKGAMSLTMLFRPPDVLFMPTNFLPLMYPRNNIVTVHGLEFEYHPEIYHGAHFHYLRRGTARAVQNAAHIIAVSEATKNDLIKFYNTDPAKISVIHYGVNSQIAYHHKYPPIDEKYILFMGRLEKKKNVHALVKAFTVLKEKYKIPHKLVLVGSPGFGFSEIQAEIDQTVYKQDIVQTGYISHEEKESFFKYADMFVLPSFYEGFGMPILEAQLRQVPVVTSRIPATTEIAGDGAFFFDPKSVDQLVEAMERIIESDSARVKLVQKGLENVRRFSWFKCAKETLTVLTTPR